MILARAPLRMSFVGGGSDILEYYTQRQGKVISTSIDKYVYVAIKEKFGGGIRVSYSKNELCNHVDEVQHPIVKACLIACGVTTGIEIVSMADIPSTGSGLGSSSSFTVALLTALFAFKNQKKSAIEIAKLACDIEIMHCGQPIGKQDQYASALGGVNVLQFHSDESVSVYPCTISQQPLEKLNSHLLVLFTGQTRAANSVLQNQKRAYRTQEKLKVMESMVSLVEPCCNAILSGDVERLGEILHENWCLKRSITHEVSNEIINDAYTAAMDVGAYGGKIMGAGAGGFFVFVADPEIHGQISEKLNMQQLKVNVPVDGSSIVYSENGVAK